MIKFITFLDNRAALWAINVLAVLGGYGAVHEPRIGLFILPALAALLMWYVVAIAFDDTRRSRTLSDWLRIVGRGSIFTLWISFYVVLFIGDDYPNLKLGLLVAVVGSALMFMLFGPGIFPSPQKSDRH